MLRIVVLVVFFLSGVYNFYLWFSYISDNNNYLTDSSALEEYFFNMEDMDVIRKVTYNFYTIETERIDKYAMIRTMGNSNSDVTKVVYDDFREKFLWLEPVEDVKNNKNNKKKKKKEEVEKVETIDKKPWLDTSALNKPKTEKENLTAD